MKVNYIVVGSFADFYIFSWLFEASVLVSVCFRISFVYILRVKGFSFIYITCHVASCAWFLHGFFGLMSFFHCVNTRPTLTTTVFDRVA